MVWTCGGVVNVVVLLVVVILFVVVVVLGVVVSGLLDVMARGASVVTTQNLFLTPTIFFLPFFLHAAVVAGVVAGSVVIGLAEKGLAVYGLAVAVGSVAAGLAVSGAGVLVAGEVLDDRCTSGWLPGKELLNWGKLPPGKKLLKGLKSPLNLWPELWPSAGPPGWGKP